MRNLALGFCLPQFRAPLLHGNARRIFIRMLVSYLITVFVIVGTIIPVLQLMRHGLQETRIHEERQKSQIALSHLNNQIDILYKTFLYITSNQGFDRISLIRDTPIARDYIAMMNVRESLSNIAGANSLITDIAVTYDHNDIVLTTQNVFDHQADFLKHYDIPAMEGEILETQRAWSNSHSFRAVQFFEETSLRSPQRDQPRTDKA